MVNTSTIVKKVWNYADVLRDDGVSYGDYVEQITYLLFLKMAEERSSIGLESTIPKELNWTSLNNQEGIELELQYRKILDELSKKKGILGKIFRKSQNKIQDPAKLQRLIHLIDQEQWSAMSTDVKGDIYEGLLAKNAEDVRSGAGQYFTPRDVIRTIVEVMRPDPSMTIADPSCGTGGFLLGAHDYIIKNYTLNKEQKRKLKEGAFYGADIVDGVVRLCAMNLYLHGIGHEESPVEVRDSLASPPSKHYDMILTNPPFGKKSSFTVVGEDGKVDKDKLIYEREDFWVTNSNKQLNFLQHIKSLLNITGKAAVVVPDNVLFEGGAGETIRKKLLKEFDFHTILRLPTGIWYSPGVKANVIFFDRKPASSTAWTKNVWIYDLRTNLHFTLKKNPLRYQDLQDFITCYNAENREGRNETERFKSFSFDELMKIEKVNLDISWIKDESLDNLDDLPDPEDIATEIVEQLQSALEEFKGIEEELESQ